MATITGSGVLVGTVGNDTITGDTTNDVLVGHSGSDTLNGGDGDDILAPDTHIYLISDGVIWAAERYWASTDDGAIDHVDGGGGFDRVAMRFDGVTANIAADFSDPSVVQTIAGSTIVNVEQLEIVLGSGNDTVVFGLGDDWVFGEAGNDTLDGGAGNDVLGGGDGTDVLSGGSGNDSLTGGEGDDTLEGGDQDDRLLGEAGDDRLIGGGGTDQLEGDQTIPFEFDAGIDTAVLAGNLADYTYAISELGDGRLRLTNSVTGEVDHIRFVEQLEFADTTAATADVVSITIEGTDGDERLRGSYVDDTINAGGGDDTVIGFGGNDVLNGGAGDDTIQGDGGNDTVNGGPGNDRLHGGDGDDIIDGGTGIDRVGLSFSTATAGVTYTIGDGVLVTSHGTKTLTNIESVDFSGSLFADTITGGEYLDLLWGDDGDDTLNGLGGNDLLFGQSGNDRLNGGGGSDRLEGGDGNDRLTGNGGGDELTGGPGADTFLFTLVSDSAPGEPDFITDFTDKGKPGHAPGGVRDKIDLSAIDANVDLAGDQSFKLVQQFTGVAGQAYISYDAEAFRTNLFLDVNGDEVADMTIQFLEIFSPISLTRSDFIL